MSGLLLIGAGPGIGGETARRFAREYQSVSLFARNTDRLKTLTPPLPPNVHTYSVDVTNENLLRSSIALTAEEHRLPDVVIYNAALVQSDNIWNLSRDDYLEAWTINVVGAAVTASAILPEMAKRGSGAFFVTGGMPEPHPRYATLSLGKAGVRALVNMLAIDNQNAGLHISTLTVAGVVEPGTPFDPRFIAEEYWNMAHQSPADWTTETVFTGPTRVE